MRIIICGAGQVGYHIAAQLTHEDHEIVLIDQREDLIHKINDTLDVKAIVGFASHPDVLKRAGADEADMLIAVTNSDEVNMVCCEVANTLFNIPTKIARVRNQIYLQPEWKKIFSTDHLPIDVVISPEIEVAYAILRRLHAPGAIDMIPFADDKVRVLGVRCEKNAALNNLPLSLAKNRAEGLMMKILGINHNGHFALPRPEMILHGDDIVYFVVATEHVKKALALFGHEEKEARRIIILGGGNIGFSIARELEEEPEIQVKIIELSRQRAEEIVEALDHTTVINGSGLDSEILAECGIDKVETIIAVTNDDKVNILASLLAKRHGCQRSMVLVNNAAYVPLLANLGIDVVVNPRESTVSSILQHVRRGKISSVHTILDGAAEIIEAEAVSTSPIVGKTIESLKLPAGIIIGAIIRKKEIIIPDENTMILERDSILLLTTSEMVRKVEKFFSVSLEFF